jgi:hypothetical protein
MCLTDFGNAELVETAGVERACGSTTSRRLLALVAQNLAGDSDDMDWHQYFPNDDVVSFFDQLAGSWLAR